MIDYHGNCVVLADFTADLTAQTFTDPKLTQVKNEALGSLAGEGGSALLGAFVYHLFTHAASDGVELALLIGQTAQGKPFQTSLKPYAGSVSDPVYCPNSPISSAPDGRQVLRFTCSAAVD